MKVKVSTATGHVLDGLVAIANGGVFHMRRYMGCSHGPMFRAIQWKYDWVELSNYSPSTNWQEGGPIIERELIDLLHVRQNDLSVAWDATFGNDDFVESGPTPLVAAMRVFVVSRFGDEVEVPEELI